jgi:hypothetical protein
MATTTTYTAIRDHSIALLEAATPRLLVQHPFRRAPRHRSILEWAPSAGSAALRKFEFRRGDEDLADPEHYGPTVLERDETMRLRVAYPRMPSLYGTGELDELERVMRSDLTLFRDVIYSGSNYLAGQSLAKIEPDEPDRLDDRCWFANIVIRLRYSEAVATS